MTDSIFMSTAKYYAKYRVPYPDAMVSRLTSACNLDGRQRLLHLGCGTGQVCLALAPHVESAVGVDPDADMLKHAARETARLGHTNVRFELAKAEEIGTSHGTFHLITAGSSFHWMDRDIVGRAIARHLLAPGGKLAILSAKSLWHGAEAWQHAVREVIQRWLGERRRADKTAFSISSETHETVLRRLGFALDESSFEARHEWSLKNFLGYLYSTSFASRHLFDDKRAQFEADLKQHDASLAGASRIPCARTSPSMHWNKRPMTISLDKGR